MDVMLIKNKHLTYTLEHAKLYLDDNEEIPMELLLNLIGELRVSNLLIPAVEKEDELVFENVVFEDDDSTYLPLFTNVEEFEKHQGDDSEFEPLDNNFELYLEIVKESGVDGIIIDLEGMCIPFDKDFLAEIPTGNPVSFSDDDEDACSKEELKEIFENPGNEEFVSFLKNDADHDDLEPLMVELSNSHLFNAVISDDPLDEFAQDGIIESSDVDGFSLFVIDDDPIHMAMIFTSKEEMAETLKDSEANFYGQITVLTDLFEFVLRNDMDGIVINPNSLEYYILREEILSQARGIELIAEDGRFRDSLDYAFLI